MIDALASIWLALLGAGLLFAARRPQHWKITLGQLVFSAVCWLLSLLLVLQHH